MNRKELIETSERKLKSAGISEPELNSQWLLSSVLKIDRLAMMSDLSQPVDVADIQAFNKLLLRKCDGEPLSYILGYQPFCGLNIKVDARVLVPRPETEELVVLAADFLTKQLKAGGKDIKILDFGTGSGAIALALAKKFPQAQVIAAEKSSAALACAKENAEALGLISNMTFLRAGAVSATTGPFDMIVSNPPYIPTRVIAGLDKEVLAEPLLALDGGADGLDLVRAIINEALAVLKPGGGLFLELGESQSYTALNLLSSEIWKDKQEFKDFSGKHRFINACRKHL